MDSDDEWLHELLRIPKSQQQVVFWYQSWFHVSPKKIFQNVSQSAPPWRQQLCWARRAAHSTRWTSGTNGASSSPQMWKACRVWEIVLPNWKLHMLVMYSRKTTGHRCCFTSLLSRGAIHPEKNYPCIYKFGFTHSLEWRWSNDVYGYSKNVGIQGFDRMVAVYMSATPVPAAMMEAVLIKEYFGTSSELRSSKVLCSFPRGANLILI